MTTTTNPDDHHLLRISTVAHLLNIPEAAVLRLAEQGEIELTSDVQYITATSLRGYMKRRNRKSTRQATKARANNEGSVYEAPRGSGIWYAALTIREGRKRRRVKRRAKSQKGALQLLEELKRQHCDNVKVELDPPTARKSITYRELFAEYLQAVGSSLEDSTKRHYQTAIDSRLNPHIGDKVVTSDDYPMLQALFNNVLIPEYSAHTLHGTRSPLNLALEYAVESVGYISKNPAKQIKLPKADAENPGIALQLSELLDILRLALKHRYGPVILFAALYGTRLAECIGVKKSDFDLEKDTVRIQRQLKAPKGGGLKPAKLKNKPSVRYLPRLPRLAAYLEKYMQERSIALKHLGYAESEGNWIFLNSKGNLLNPRLVEEAFDEILEQTGLAEKYPAVKRAGYTPTEGSYKAKVCAISFHDLRHTLLTQMGDLGVDETTRGRIAGHGPKNATQIYDRGTILRMRVGMEAFEEIIFRTLGLDGGEA